jgi:hypothetical protein
MQICKKSLWLFLSSRCGCLPTPWGLFGLIGAMALAVAGASVAQATDITYSVNLTIGTGSVTGDIVTDGSTGTLLSSDVVDWNLLLTEGPSIFDLTPADSSLIDGGDPLSATTSATLDELLFNYTLTEYVAFIDQPGGPGTTVLGQFCLQSTEGECDFIVDGPDDDFCIGSSCQTASETGTQVIGTAEVPETPVPEPSTLALLGAAVGMLAALRRRRKACNPQFLSFAPDLPGDNVSTP